MGNRNSGRTPAWKAELVKTAKELCYSREVRAAVMNANTENEAARIMRDARIAAAEKEDAAR